MNMPSKCFAFALSLALSGGAALADGASDMKLQKMEQQIDTLSQQLEAMKAQLQELKSQNEALAAQQEAQKPMAVAADSAGAAVQTAKASPFGSVSLGGYGEIYYVRPVHDPSQTVADLARAVFSIGYRFDDRTHFNSEFEVEHAVSSADDVGEFEVEQFYVDHQLSNYAAIKAGLFLMPAGLINEHHEPPNFYGVQRNFVETLIIPSTWREGGVGLHGNTEFGFGYDFGLTTGLNLSNWDINAELPIALEDRAPMQATHQELSLANAEHLAQYVALSYNGLPGFLAGASVFTGDMAKFQADLPSKQRATLWEAHTRWTPGAADLSAVYARGVFSNTAEANRLFPGASNPIPASFFGYYLQAAYSVWQQGGHRIAPFLRWERFNTARSYAGIPQGFTAAPQPTERVWTYGANFYLNPHLVFKADYQQFHSDHGLSRIDLGLGLDF